MCFTPWTLFDCILDWFGIHRYYAVWVVPSNRSGLHLAGVHTGPSQLVLHQLTTANGGTASSICFQRAFSEVEAKLIFRRRAAEFGVDPCLADRSFRWA